LLHTKKTGKVVSLCVQTPGYYRPTDVLYFLCINVFCNAELAATHFYHMTLC